MLIKVLDKIFPFVAAIIVNRKINSSINYNEYDNKVKKWYTELSDSKVEPCKLEKISSDIYDSQDRRISNIENKAISLIVSIGFSISLLTIIIGFTEDDFYSIKFVAVMIFSISIFIMILAATSAILAYRIGKRSVPTLIELSNTLKDSINDKVLLWAAHHLSSAEINVKLGLMKSNLVDSSQRHMLTGLVTIFIGSILLIIDAFFFSSISIEIDFIDNFIQEIFTLLER